MYTYLSSTTINTYKAGQINFLKWRTFKIFLVQYTYSRMEEIHMTREYCTIASLDPICPFIAKLPIFDIFIYYGLKL